MSPATLVRIRLTLYHATALGILIFIGLQDNTTRNYDQGSPHPTGILHVRCISKMLTLIFYSLVSGAWVQSGGAPGRSFYTSLGNLNETWKVIPFAKTP